MDEPGVAGASAGGVERGRREWRNRLGPGGNGGARAGNGGARGGNGGARAGNGGARGGNGGARAGNGGARGGNGGARAGNGGARGGIGGARGGNGWGQRGRPGPWVFRPQPAEGRGRGQANLDPAQADHNYSQRIPNIEKRTYFYVKGYPAKATVKEVMMAIGEHIPVQLAERSSWGMMLFTEHEGGIRHLPPISLHGQPLRIFNRGMGLNGPPPGVSRRDFPRSKENSRVVDPRSILLEGTLCEQWTNVCDAVRITKDRVRELHLLYDQIEEALKPIWPGCEALPFGSIMSGLGMASSDADCFVSVAEEFYRPDGQLVKEAEQALRRYPHYFTEILAITGANTPIVKLFHLPTGFNCDISFKSYLGVANSHLIGILMQVNRAVLPCMLLIKYWARVNDITGPGRISNYALTLMFVFYLQMRSGLIPPIESLQQDPRCELEENGWNAGFTLPRQYIVHVPTHEFLAGFFIFYARFDFDRYIICPYLGSPVEKSRFATPTDVPSNFARYLERLALGEGVTPLKAARPVCVQDPFDHTHNVASAVSNNVLQDIKDHFTWAAEAYAAELDNDCEGLLRKILLDGPPRAKKRKPCAPLIVRYPMARRVLVQKEWREAMTTATTTVLDTMLMLDLVPRPTKQHRHQELHAWETALDKPIWKRKRFNNVYSRMKFNFIETQTRITRDVIAVHKEELFLRMEFQLRLKGSVISPRAILTMRYIDGDVDAFVELKGFLAARMKGWLSNVLKIQLQLSDIQEVFDEADAIAINYAVHTAAMERGSDPDSDTSASESDDDE